MRFVAAPLALGLLLATGAFPVVAGQASVIPGTVVTGSCDRNRVAFELSDLNLPNAQLVGAPGGLTAATSFTTLPITFDELLAVDHAIIAGDACGLIGGSLTPDGFLAISLEGSGGAHGIAFVAPSASGAETDLTVFLAPGSSLGTGGRSTSTASDTSSGTSGATTTSGAVAEAESAYLNDASGIMLEMGESLDRFGELMSDPRVDETNWTQNVIDEVTLWNALLQDLEDLTPPPAFDDMHENLLDAFFLYADAGADVIDGMRDLDVVKIESAIGKIERANALVDDAAIQLDEIRVERGL